MATVIRDRERVERFLTRGVENSYPNRDAVRERMMSGEPMVAYLGVDPTAPTLHLGNAIVLRKLAELQHLGHKVILLIGDFTARIGDPTDKLAARKQLTHEETLANAKIYKKQASTFISFDGPNDLRHELRSNAAKMLFNSEWLGKMAFADVVDLASHFTVQQMLERDMFRRRMSWRSICPFCGNENLMSPETQDVASDEHGNSILVSTMQDATWKCRSCKREYAPESGVEVHSPRPVYLHEFLYPLMQGYDSVAMDVDMEIGGNDQTFNMLAGRTLMREMKQKEKFVVACKLLVDPTGKKMGKTEGNLIALNDAPEDMYGKVMSWTDGMILPGFELCTDVSDEEIDSMRADMDRGENPMAFKLRLAKEIVASFSSSKEADAAEERFSTVHQKHEVPDDVPTFKMSKPMKLVDALVASGLVLSKSEARRQIEQGGIKVDEQVVSDPQADVSPGLIIQKGKRHFVKLI